MGLFTENKKTETKGTGLFSSQAKQSPDPTPIVTPPFDTGIKRGLFSNQLIISPIQGPVRTAPRPNITDIGKSSNFFGGTQAILDRAKSDTEQKKFESTPIPEKEIRKVRGSSSFVPPGMTGKELAGETIKGLPQAASETIGQPTLRAYAATGGFLTGLFGGENLTPHRS